MSAGRLALLFVCSAVALMAGCTKQPPPGFSLRLAASALTIQQGATAVTEATVACDAGFAGSVALGVDAPAGVTGSFAPDTLALGCAESSTLAHSMLTLEVDVSVQPGTYEITVLGKSGDATARAKASLTVTERGYSLTGIPDEVVVSPPTLHELPVIIDRTDGFSEAVTLTLEGAPAGVSSSFAPNPSTTTATTLTLNVADTASPGTYPLTVRSESAHGYGDTVTFSLVVRSPTHDDFNLLLDPTSLTLKQGQQADVTVTIERTPGFTAPVALSAAVTPDAQHITVTFTPASAADGSVMTVTVGINVPPRTYQVVVQGLSDRLVDDAPLHLLVNGDPYVTPVTHGGR